MNYSRQREIILDTLIRNAVHPTADTLFSIIKKENPDTNLGIATVYRNLKKLADLGIIKRIEGLEEAEHFDHNTHIHYHFMCKKCGKVFDINSDVTTDIIENVEKQTGFIVEAYDIAFHGICKDCQE